MLKVFVVWFVFYIDLTRVAVLRVSRHANARAEGLYNSSGKRPTMHVLA